MDPFASSLTRRSLLRAGGGLALGAALVGGLDTTALAARRHPLRRPDSLPDPLRPAGEADASMPFDHVVIVMQENHTFDSYLGMLSRRGQPLADGFTFNAQGLPINSNPYMGGYTVVQPAPSDCTLSGSASQSWDDTHLEINGGRMNGFAAAGVDAMAYWDEPDLPFYYSLAKTFCLANRWFCSAPCQTYPNRRFLQAGTAFGLISTDTSSVTEYPPNGTIWDRLDALGITWADYFTQVPTAAIIADTLVKYPANIVPIARFYADCAAGTLPAVSMVDSGIGAADDLAGLLGVGNVPGLPAGAQLSNIDQDEENGNISEGENFVSHVVNAVLRSPLWPRVLLVWLYDEHGGNYDHVPPPAAIPPDAIPPALKSGDAQGGYDIYGPRVPAVVMSGYSRPHAVTNVVHDHTSILATIEAKWNVPALTHRDANAATLADFLVTTGKPTFPEPPTLAVPSNEIRTQADCDPGPISFPVYTNPPTRTTALPEPTTNNNPTSPGKSGTPGKSGKPSTKRKVIPLVELRVVHDHHPADSVVLELRHSAKRPLTDLQIELQHDRRIVARGHLAKLGKTWERVTLRHHPLLAGRYTITVRAHGRVVLVHTEQLKRTEV